MIKYPIFYKDETFKYRITPENLKETVLRHYPLTKEFIDWLAEQGFEIIYFSDWEEGVATVWWSLKWIGVSFQGERTLIIKTLVHELVHIAIPGVPSPYARWWESEEFEKAIDETADVYLKDLELLKYIEKTIPVLKDK